MCTIPHPEPKENPQLRYSTKTVKTMPVLIFPQFVSQTLNSIPLLYALFVQLRIKYKVAEIK